jgi:hypothetical protein
MKVVLFPIMKAVDDIWEQDPQENARIQVGGRNRIIKFCMKIFIIYILFVYLRSIYQAISSSDYTL